MSVRAGASQLAKARKPRRPASGHREMLMAISGKHEGKSEAKAPPTRPSGRHVSGRLDNFREARPEDLKASRSPARARKAISRVPPCRPSKPWLHLSGPPSLLWVRPAVRCGLRVSCPAWDR
jgi:hypothetical protein